MIHQLAITIIQQGTRDGWLREVAEWLQGHEKVLRMVAAEEVGADIGRHLQGTIEATVGDQQMRLLIHERFMELRGEKHQKGKKMSCAPVKTSWERSVAYCLKESGAKYVKNVPDEELERCRVEGEAQAKKVKKDQPSWIEQIRRECEAKRVRWEDDIGDVIVRLYMQKKRVIPDGHQLARLIQTMEIMLAKETQDDKIRDLVKQALQIKNKSYS
jgi:hypothetical protein